MELTRGPEYGDGCNAFALPGNHKSQKKEKRKVEKDRKKNSVCMSKNQQRKLRRLQEEKDKRARRSSALEILEKHKLRDDAHALLSSSGNIGQVSQVDGGKLDAQTSGASKEFEWAPVGTNFVVHVSRPPDVEESRKNLPIIMMEQEIMEAISHHSTVIICGETGCGKTTQVPQFLFEAGFGSRKGKERAANIGVTQPRRVAVLATTKRVAYELSFQLGKEVGFQVRHDRRIGENSSIKFMTDGILLREVQSDFLLRRYSIIVLDEAHERSLNTDILIGLLSRIVPLRQSLYDEQQRKILHGVAVSPEHVITPLKLVLMSATLRIEDFVSNRKLFPTSPPVVEVATRQFPVTIHFSAKTELVDYLGKAHKKVLAIHKKLPPGGILVFVTGQREVEYLCRQLKKAFVKRNKSNVKIQCISQKNKAYCRCRLCCK